MGAKSCAINLVKTKSNWTKIRPVTVVIPLRRCYRTKNRIMGRTSMRLMSFAFCGLAFAALTGLAACNTSSPTSILGLGGANNKDLAPPPSGTITESELRAFCPNVELREGTAFFTKYEKGGAPTDTTEADKTKVIHQASLGEVTRACSYSGETLTINVAASGRLVPGPKAVAGPVTLPIRRGDIRRGGSLFAADPVPSDRRPRQRRSDLCVQRPECEPAQADRPVIPGVRRL
jgi:hypothetical protein